MVVLKIAKAVARFANEKTAADLKAQGEKNPGSSRGPLG